MLSLRQKLSFRQFILETDPKEQEYRAYRDDSGKEGKAI